VLFARVTRKNFAHRATGTLPTAMGKETANKTAKYENNFV
jgi:hypothetical protein